MEGHVDVLLKKFTCIPVEPPTVEASDGSDVDDELAATGTSWDDGHGDDDPSS